MMTLPVGSGVGLLKVRTVVALPLLSAVVALMNDTFPRETFGNAELIASKLALYCNVTTAVVTVSLDGIFRMTGMPPLSGPAVGVPAALNTRFIESEASESGPRAKSGMLTVTAAGGGEVTKNPEA